jgi:RNA polymerase sigma-70 factor, ECF subfamily
VSGAVDLDALILRAQDGDVRAFEALIADQLPKIRRFARAFAASEADADDLAQDALVKVYLRVRLFRYQSAFSTWVYAVVRNVFLDSTRQRGARDRFEPLQPHHLRNVVDDATPDRHLEAEQESRHLWNAIRALPAEFRTAVVLFDIEGATYDEVANVEGVPVGTVKSRLSRGRAHLRRILESDPGARVGTGSGTVEPAFTSKARRRGT